MPGMVKPMLARLVDKPFDDKEWLFELKWDGYRAIAELNEGKVKIYSRNGLSFNKFNIIHDELEKLNFNAVLDGEIVALDEDGYPRFQYLQNYEEGTSGYLQYNVFDILYYDGYNLEQVPLIERKELLKQILGDNERIRYSDHIIGTGIAFYEEVKKKGLEGIMGKLANSPYRPDKRSGEWVKIKTGLRQEAIICGYTEPKGSRHYFGSLVLGLYDTTGKLICIGSSGGGFDEDSLKDIYDKLQKLKQEQSPFSYKIPLRTKAHWVKPELICEVSFSEWTGDKQMRHPVFQGLRPDKKPGEVTMEIAESTKKTVKKAENIPLAKTNNKTMNKPDTTFKIGGHSLAITNTDKILWPGEGITKGDLISYYKSVAQLILPHLKDRPQSLHRYPNGIHAPGFYQKNVETAPDWAKTVAIESDSKNETVHYLICNDEATLIYMANLACIEINPWNSRTSKLGYPDWIVMDIDPGDTNTFEQVIDTALVIKTILDKAKAEAFIKTSGATGLHIYIPLGARYTYEEGKTFAHIIAKMTTEQLPDTTTIERSLKNRDGKIYVDYLQNNEGQTLASAYSVRPKPGATVSTPLQWEELKHGLSPADFTIKNVLKRFEKQGDIFKPVLGKGIDMAKCLKLIAGN